MTQRFGEQYEGCIGEVHRQIGVSTHQTRYFCARFRCEVPYNDVACSDFFHQSRSLFDTEPATNQMYSLGQHWPRRNQAFRKRDCAFAPTHVPGVVAIKQRIEESCIGQDHPVPRTRSPRRPEFLAAAESVNSSFALTETSLRPLPDLPIQANRCVSCGARSARTAE